MIHELELEICERPCIVRLYNWEPYRPGYISGAPEHCYPAEGGYGDWEVFDLDGNRAEDVEREMSDRTRDWVEEQLFNMMER